MSITPVPVATPRYTLVARILHWLMALALTDDMLGSVAGGGVLAKLSRQRRVQKCLRLINKNCVELARHDCGDYAREGLNAIAGVLDVGGLLVETPRAFIQ